MPAKRLVKVGDEWWPRELAAPVAFQEPSPLSPTRSDTPGRQRPAMLSQGAMQLPLVMLPQMAADGQLMLAQLPQVPPKAKAKGKG